MKLKDLIVDEEQKLSTARSVTLFKTFGEPRVSLSPGSGRKQV